MELNGKDFDELMFPCYDVKEGMEIFELYPVLKLYKEFKIPLEQLSLVKIFKYVCFLYDEKSPLRQIDDFIKRSIEASRFALFPTIDGENKFTEPYMKVIKNENPEVLKMIIRFCRMQGSMTFSQLVIMEEIYYKELQDLKSLEETKDRATAIKNISNLRVEIEELKRSLLADSNSKALELLLFKEIEGESLGVSPEEIAAIYNEGNNISDYKKYVTQDDYISKP